MQSIQRFAALLIAALILALPAFAAPEALTTATVVKRVDESASSKSMPTPQAPAITAVRDQPAGTNVKPLEIQPKEEAINSRWTMYFTGGAMLSSYPKFTVNAFP
jgi:hypothetical protein